MYYDTDLYIEYFELTFCGTTLLLITQSRFVLFF